MRIIREVIDTNIFVSGVISSKGAPRRILDLARKEKFKVVTSISINKEILEVLHRDYIYNKYGLTEAIVDDIASFLYEGRKFRGHLTNSFPVKSSQSINPQRQPHNPPQSMPLQLKRYFAILTPIDYRRGTE